MLIEKLEGHQNKQFEKDEVLKTVMKKLLREKNKVKKYSRERVAT